MPTRAFLPMSTNVIQTLICFVGGLSCLFPLLMDSIVDFSDSSLLVTLRSLRFRDSAVFAISVTLPIFVDILSELFSAVALRNKSEKVKMNAEEALLNTRERFILYCGIMTIPITAFFPPGTRNLVNIYLCLRRSRSMFVFGAVITSSCRYDVNFWPEGRTYSLLLLLICATTSGALADNISVLGTFSPMRITAAGFYLLAGAIFFYSNINWAYSAIPRLFKKMTTATSDEIQESLGTNNHPRRSNLVFPLLYATASTTVCIVSVVASKAYGGEDSYSTDALFVHNLVFIIYLMVIMYISERKLKYEVVQGLYALIESKKMYVRYISHELRTPLNSAFLGLKLVCDDLQTSNDADSEHCETLLDVQSACRIAVEILNDLLCFDKLESGILELHKHDVTVMPFIANCVSMFGSQAKEAGIAMSNITGDGMPPLSCDLSYLSSSKLFQGDTVTMDKFKMDQVLRNLISNAMKFTPRGGSVTVCASFLPCNDEDNESNSCNSPLHTPQRQFDTVHEGSRRDGGLRRGAVESTDSTRESVTHHDRGVLAFWKILFGRLRGVIPTLRHTPSVIEGITNVESGSHLYRSPSTQSYAHSHVELNANASRTMEELHRSNSTPSALFTDLEYESLRSSRSSSQADIYRTVVGKLQIVVSDSGAGISTENQSKLFKEIVQFNPEVLQAGGGSGLGLWITSSIVKMHGGSISVHSAGLGKGSTFTVEIDMQRRVAVTPSHTLQHSTSVSSPSLSILCGLDTGRQDDLLRTAHNSSRYHSFHRECVAACSTVTASPTTSGKGNACPSKYVLDYSTVIRQLEDIDFADSRNSNLDMDADVDVPLCDQYISSPHCISKVPASQRSSKTRGELFGINKSNNNSNINSNNNRGVIDRSESQAMGIRRFSDGVGEGRHPSDPLPTTPLLNVRGLFDENNTATMLSPPSVSVSPSVSVLGEERVPRAVSGTTSHASTTNTAITTNIGTATGTIFRSNGQGQGLSVSTEMRPLGSVSAPSSTVSRVCVDRVGEVIYDVLVVDDSSLNRKMLLKLLRNAGYTCDEADDGVNAVAKVKERMARGGGGGEGEKKGEGGDKGEVGELSTIYDAILMDFVMPNMDGPTATQSIRSLGYTAPIFGVTGNTLDSDITHFVSKGANAVIPKPFDFARFKYLMRDLG